MIIYYSETYREQIEKIIEIIRDSEKKPIKDYKKGTIKDLIKECISFEETAKQINDVKDFLLFKEIYKQNIGKTEKDKFEKSLDTLNQIGKYIIKNNNDTTKLYNEYKVYFEKIKQSLSNKELEAKEFIDKFKSYYKIKNEQLISELTILFKSKKYEVDIESIIFFFRYFQKDNKKWNEKISEEKYKDLSQKDFNKIKECLKELKGSGIYDYEEFKIYNKLFTCLYEKEEAIDFLFKQTKDKIEELKNRIEPTDSTINIKDLIDTIKCIDNINEMKKLKDNFKILNYIKSMKKDTVDRFENYSKIYSSVIDLERNKDTPGNLFETVNNIIKNATFEISQDTENFLIKDEEKENEYKKITMDELIHLKNKIQIKNEEENESEDENKSGDKKEDEDDIIKSKCRLLNFFKKTISNLEIINNLMKVLRKKGSSLPIKITIQITTENNKPSLVYYLGGTKTDIQEIKDYLFKAKNKYITQLITKYRKNLNLRFLYGKQFRTIMKHLESNLNIDSFLRYIVNNTDNNETIHEGYKAVIRNVNDYIKDHELYNENSLDSISAYITTLFNKNGKTVEEHYEKMRIISDEVNKGIYLHECDKDSMEEFIINMFWQKINKLPIA